MSSLFSQRFQPLYLVHFCKCDVHEMHITTTSHINKSFTLQPMSSPADRSKFFKSQHQIRSQEDGQDRQDAEGCPWLSSRRGRRVW
jgi:hypothetical protein